jgi:hypothetical protein
VSNELCLVEAANEDDDSGIVYENDAFGREDVFGRPWLDAAASDDLAAACKEEDLMNVDVACGIVDVVCFVVVLWLDTTADERDETDLAELAVLVSFDFAAACKDEYFPKLESLGVALRVCGSLYSIETAAAN